MENSEIKNETSVEAKKQPIYKDKNVILAAIIVVLLVAYGIYTKKIDVKSWFQTGLSQEQAKTKVEDFVKNNLIAPGTEFSVKEAVEENGLYKVTVTVGKQEIVSYLTKDGKKFFPQVMDIAEVEKQAADAKKQAEESNKEIPKADKPTVDLYVMSFCPYGNKSEDTLKPAYDLLKNKVDFNFHYIVSSNGDEIQSLHGVKEVDQNKREACVLKDYGKDKWFNFVAYVNKNCGSDGACWEAGAKAGGLDTAKISGCVAAQGVALMKANEEASKNANASGSPTMTINGVSTKAVYQYGNSEAYKQAICDAFNKAPAECSKVLASNGAAAASDAAPASCSTPPAQ